jgi:hypothetical protein
MKLDKQTGNHIFTHVVQGGHGRSAAIIFAWLCHNEHQTPPVKHNQQLGKQWKVRKTLHSQPSINKVIGFSVNVEFFCFFKTNPLFLVSQQEKE